MPWVGLQCVIVVFPDHIHLRLEKLNMKMQPAILEFKLIRKANMKKKSRAFYLANNVKTHICDVI